MRERNEALDCLSTPARLHRRRVWIASRNVTGGNWSDNWGWPVRQPLKHLTESINEASPNAVASLFLATVTPVGA